MRLRRRRRVPLSRSRLYVVVVDAENSRRANCNMFARLIR